MEFSEASKVCALKFLEKFASSQVLPEAEDSLPIRPNWPQLEEGEVEAECLEMSRRYLAGIHCPGLLSYFIAAEATQRLLSLSQDPLKTPDSQMWEGILVARQLLHAIHAICKEWLDQFPSLLAPSDKTELSMYGMKNTRRKMEDRYALCLDVNSLYGLKDVPPQTYYAVFDGHDGEAAAVYASVHLLTNIVRQPTFQDDLATAIKEGVRITDERFCKKGIRSGTTAVLTFIRGKSLYVGWLGDSQALLVQGGKPLQLVDPHKPEREDEQKRIEEAGGMVIWMGAWRVNGNLSVSRAIGDAKEKQFIVGTADVSTFELDGSEEYMLVACDGVWDVLSGEEVVECVGAHLASDSGSRQTAAQSIVQLAKAEGSGDNMTAILVYFKGFQAGLSAAATKDEEKLCD